MRALRNGVKLTRCSFDGLILFTCRGLIAGMDVRMTAQDKRAKFALHNINFPEAALGTFAILLGIYVAIDATGYHDGSTYDSLGPSLLPYIIAAGLTFTGLPILISALFMRGPDEAFAQVDWMPIAWIV